MTRADRQPSHDRYEHLTGGDLLAGAGASFVALVVSLGAILAPSVPNLAANEIVLSLIMALVFATPVWLAVMMVAGFPLMFWIERRTLVDATLVRKFAPYVVAGVVIGAALYYVYPGMAPISVVCAVASRIGAGWWRSRRHPSRQSHRR